jgi:hypothetical protein
LLTAQGVDAFPSTIFLGHGHQAFVSPTGLLRMALDAQYDQVVVGVVFPVAVFVVDMHKVPFLFAVHVAPLAHPIAGLLFRAAYLLPVLGVPRWQHFGRSTTPATAATE